MGAVLILIVVIFIYFFPAMVAGMRDHSQGLAIFVLNLLTGWTALGWVAALVWACTNTGRGVGA
jgi:T4 superinfection immunity protein